MAKDWLARILIVDDEAAHLRALCETLQDQGYETIGFTVGKAALDVLRQTTCDVLLADLMMVEMDGITLLREALQVDPHLIGIIMTGHGTIPTAVEALQTGAFDYILKPFKLSDILPLLSRALAVRRLRVDKAELEEHLRQRTAELEAVNRELESFCYSVAHDLRAPLRSIAGFSRLMVEDYGEQLDPSGQNYLQRVLTAVERMDQLIDDLLVLSRVNQADLVRQRINLSAIARAVADDLQHTAPERQVQFLITDNIQVHGDERLLRVALENLLGNAWKFTSKKPVAEIEFGAQTGPEGQLVCVVRDNGAGFDMQYASHLFGAFQRLHGPDQFPGTGIGLATVQRIINRHGGRIWAEAKVDEGATFYFSLYPPRQETASA